MMKIEIFRRGPAYPYMALYRDQDNTPLYMSHPDLEELKRRVTTSLAPLEAEFTVEECNEA